MTRAYGLLLKLYPKDHRALFEAEMAAVFEEGAEEHHRRGWFSLLRFAFAEAVGLIEDAGAQWLSAPPRSEHADSLAVAGNTRSALPAEIVECQARIQQNLRRMEYAIAHHQFERARFFSTADEKEREHLSRLWASYGLGGKPDTILSAPKEEH